MKFEIKYSGLALVLALSIVLGGLCGCATKALPKASGETPQDQKISLMIQRELADDSLFEYSEVEIITVNGVVELKGYVSKWEAIDHAGMIVKYTKGVKQLHNNLVEKQ